VDSRATQLLRGCSELCHGDWSEGEGLCRNQNVNAHHAIEAIAHTQAWQTIACPVVAKITLYTVISGSLTALAFVRSNEDCGGDLNDAFFRLPYLYARAMMKRARQNSMFAVAGLSVAFTWGYLLWSVPHIVGYMSSH
jgi:hypothetical protein